MSIMFQEFDSDIQRRIEMLVTNGRSYRDYDRLECQWKCAMQQADHPAHDFLEPYALKFRLGLYEFGDNHDVETFRAVAEINFARINLIFDPDYLEYYQQMLNLL